MVTLLSLTVVLGYAAFRSGATLPEEWLPALLGLGVLSAWVFARSSPIRRGRSTASKAALCLAVVLPIYVALQLVPLPDGVMSVLSPARAKLADSLAAAELRPDSYPLSASPAATVAHLLRLLGYAAAFLAIRETALRRGRDWALAIPIVAPAAAEALLGLLQVQLGEPMATGTFVNRNHFAGMLELALPFALVYPFSVLRPEEDGLRHRSERAIPLRRSLAAAAGWGVAAILLAGLMLSLSRAGFLIGLFAVGQAVLIHLTLTWAPARSGRRLAAALAAVALVLLAVIFLPSDELLGRFTDLAATEQVSADTRARFWSETLDLAGDYLVLGCGFGAYGTAFQAYREAAPNYQVSFAHNDYLQLLAELGLVGALLVLVPILLIWLRLLRRIEADHRPHRRYLALACVIAINSLALHSIVDFNLYIPANALAFALVLGVAAALAHRPWTAENVRKA